MKPAPTFGREVRDMSRATITITTDKLRRCAAYAEAVADYPLYGATANLTRSQLVLFAELLQLNLDNETTVRVTVELT